MGHLCLRFVRARLEFVKVRQLFPVVVLVLVGVVMVGAHDVIGHTGVRLLWPRDSEERGDEVRAAERRQTAALMQRSSLHNCLISTAFTRIRGAKTAFTHR